MESELVWEEGEWEVRERESGMVRGQSKRVGGRSSKMVGVE